MNSERTTIDPDYNFLSLTAAGLQVVLAHEYANGVLRKSCNFVTLGIHSAFDAKIIYTKEK